MKAYRVTRKYVCLDEAIVEANSRREAIEKFSEPQFECNTKVIRNYPEKAAIIGYPEPGYKAFTETD